MTRLSLTPVIGTDAKYAVSGAFDDDDIIHVEGDVNPVRDLDIIHNELRLKVLIGVLFVFLNASFMIGSGS